jgi:uncharacterized surface anchored protein
MKFLKNSTSWFLIVLASVFFLFLPLAEAQTTGSITGRVLDSLNVPVAGLRVDVCAADNMNDWKINSIRSTDSNGNYTLPDLAPGSYKVRYSAYTVSALGLTTEWYNDKSDFSNATPVTVIAGQTTPLDDALLSAGGSISGVVTDASGINKIQGVVVYAYNSSNNWQSATTNSNGAYTIAGLTTGNYTVYFGAFNTSYISVWYNNKQTQVQADLVSVSAPSNTSNINALLESGGDISGKVTIGSSAGPAVAGAWINVCDSSSTVCDSSSSTWRGFAKTAADGSYRVSGLPSSENYKVQFFEKTVSNAGAGVMQFYNNKQDISSADSVSVGATGINAVFAGATIAGTVTDINSIGIANVTVAAYDSNGNTVATSMATQADGKYTISGLVTGSYKLYFNADGIGYASEWYDNKSISIDNATVIRVTSLSDTITADAELDKKTNLAPTVYNLLLLRKKTP